MCRIRFLRRHYPDQVQGTEDGDTSHISAGLASSAPGVCGILRQRRLGRRLPRCSDPNTPEIRFVLRIG